MVVVNGIAIYASRPPSGTNHHWAVCECNVNHGDSLVFEVADCTNSGVGWYAHLSDELLKTLICAISMKNWIHSQVPHPNRTILVGGLQPLECLLFALQGCVYLRQSVR